MRPQSAELWLQSMCFYPTLDISISKIMKPGKCLGPVKPLAIRVNRSSPENFSRGSGTRPDDRVHVGWIRLFCPQELLSSKYKPRFRVGKISLGIKRVRLFSLSDCHWYQRTSLTFCHDLNGSHHELPFVKFPTHVPCPQSG